MATIPLQLAQRRLEAGNGVSYPEGSPAGRAMQDLGDELSAVAERYRQMKERQEAFDAELARRRFAERIAQAEDEVAANAPADGGGLHDAMYGEVDPRSGQVVKPGLFDRLFDEALPDIPESQRAAFARQKEPMRAAGSPRMAQRQQEQRDEYELAEWAKVDTMSTSSIAKGDPNDIGAFEAIRQNGSDLIAKIGNPVIRQAAEVAWSSNTAKALVQAMIAQDPKRAAEMLGGARASMQVSTTDNAVNSSAAATKLAANSNVSIDEPAGYPETPHANAATWAAGSWIADLSPDDLQELGQNVQVAMTEQLFDAHTNIRLARQNAPDALMYTGGYAGKKPDDGDFAAVYGVEEGGKQSLVLERTFEVGLQAFDMVRMPKDAIDAKLFAAKPKPGSTTSEQDQAQFEIASAAARQVLQTRAAAPADFVRKIDPTADAYWNAVSSEDSYDPAAYQKAVARSVAVQLQLGIKKVQPLPPSVVKYLVDTLNDERVPQRERDAVLRDLFTGTSDPGVLAAMALQLSDENQSRIARSIANNSVPVSAEERVSRNLAAFDALPGYLKPLVALNDTVRLMADGATLGYSDKFAARMNSLISGSNYEEELAAERARTQDALDRAGPAGTAAEALGAYLSGRGLGEAGITLSGRFGTATMEGLSGLLARTGLMGAEGAAYGGVEAAGRDESIVSGVASGALWGAGNQFLKEGSIVVHDQLPGWLGGRSKSLRRKWEKEYNLDWPRDPDTGWYMDLHHKQPKSLGGTDDVWNYGPLSKADHIKHHKEQGHFKMWGSWSRGKRGLKP
ncbi:MULTISPECIES: HNH endonuclease signature motif containing protein [unclassified Mesorhizobium]|uniref:HNH endonuclease signature motif containing protein n=1 Tax=unclassified Mesorhizobium TaxID=325217 RepID=UPI0015E41E1A|nr:MULTISPECIES: HNH endonuclease signature motif containing protein [unclassified Mesorhizobium]